jgi:hypothetical protein
VCHVLAQRFFIASIWWLLWLSSFLYSFCYWLSLFVMCLFMLAIVCQELHSTTQVSYDLSVESTVWEYLVFINIFAYVYWCDVHLHVCWSVLGKRFALAYGAMDNAALFCRGNLPSHQQCTKSAVVPYLQQLLVLTNQLYNDFIIISLLLLPSFIGVCQKSVFSVTLFIWASVNIVKSPCILSLF